MRKVGVTVALTYYYEVEVPESEMDDVVNYCDVEDPAYGELTQALNRKELGFDGNTISIVDVDTGEEYYVL